MQNDGSLNVYHVLTVDGISPTVRFKAAGKEPDYQMRIMFDRAFHSDSINGLRGFRHDELLEVG